MECSLFNSNHSHEFGYYEGHIAVNTNDIAIINEICQKYGLHYSKNVRKKDVAMISMRVYDGFNSFESKMNNIVDSLVLAGVVPIKIMKEFCYFDDNEDYDKRFFEKGAL